MGKRRLHVSARIDILQELSADREALKERLEACHASEHAKVDQLASTPLAKLDMLRSKSSPLYGEPDSSLQDWALQACWPETDPGQMGELHAEENRVELDATPEQIRAKIGGSADSIEASAGALEHQDSVLLGGSDSDTPEHLKDVLSIDRSLSSPEVEMRHLFELSPEKADMSPGADSPQPGTAFPKVIRKSSSREYQSKVQSTVFPSVVDFFQQCQEFYIWHLVMFEPSLPDLLCCCLVKMKPGFALSSDTA